jgi:uncharacterized cupin superfamily protein
MSDHTVRRLSIAAPDIHFDDSDPDGFRSGGARIGKLVGSASSGMSIYELPPGQAICPYHYEYPEEEWLLVLWGRPTLRHPGGEEDLAAWDVVFFPPGPEGAHLVRNDTEDPVRVLMFSTVTPVAAAVYPDSGKIGVWTGNSDDDVMVKKESRVGYWEGETGSA